MNASALSGKFPYEWKLEKFTEKPPLSAKRHCTPEKAKSSPTFAIVSLLVPRADD